MANEGKNKHQKFWIGMGLFSLLVVLAAILLPYFLTVNTGSPLSRNSSNVRQTILAIKSYAGDHDGNYPPIDPVSGTLSILLKEGYLDADYPLYWFHPKTKEKIPWLYNPGLSEASDPSTPLLAQPIRFSKKRIVGYTGGQVIAERDAPDTPFQWPPKPAEPPLAAP